jgi:hypothetical protein
MASMPQCCAGQRSRQVLNMLRSKGFLGTELKLQLQVCSWSLVPRPRTATSDFE